MASLIPLPDPPAAGASVMLEYWLCSGVTSCCRYGYRRLEPASLRVTGLAGLPVAVGGTAVVAVGVFDELPQAARARAAATARGIRRFKVAFLVIGTLAGVMDNGPALSRNRGGIPAVRCGRATPVSGMRITLR